MHPTTLAHFIISFSTVGMKHPFIFWAIFITFLLNLKRMGCYTISTTALFIEYNFCSFPICAHFFITFRALFFSFSSNEFKWRLLSIWRSNEIRVSFSKPTIHFWIKANESFMVNHTNHFNFNNGTLTFFSFFKHTKIWL